MMMSETLRRKGRGSRDADRYEKQVYLFQAPMRVRDDVEEDLGCMGTAPGALRVRRKRRGCGEELTSHDKDVRLGELLAPAIALEHGKRDAAVDLLHAQRCMRGDEVALLLDEWHLGYDEDDQLAAKRGLQGDPFDEQQADVGLATARVEGSDDVSLLRSAEDLLLIASWNEVGHGGRCCRHSTR